MIPGVCLSVSLPVCLSRSFTRLRCANTAKRVEVLLAVETLGVQEILGFPGDLLPHLESRLLTTPKPQISDPNPKPNHNLKT